MPGAGDYPASWYAATIREPAVRAALVGEIDADVCIIGGGYTGLSAALHLAERGYSVALLESRRLGWGASGRNGGQIGTGQRRDEHDLEQRFGADRALQLFHLAEAAKQLVRDLVARHRIDCELTPGQLLAAAKPGHAANLRRRAERLAGRYGYPHMRFLQVSELRELVDTDAYHGGCLDSGAAHLHPLKFALGLAGACAAAGVRLYEQSAAVSYRAIGDTVMVRTREGSVRSRWLMLACNGYLGGLEPELASRMMPINNFLVATAPLAGAVQRPVITGDFCVHDTLFVLNYYRMSSDGRLLFGGGENYRRAFPADIAGFVRPHLLRIFPQLSGVSLDYAWGGTLAITLNRLPHLGRLAPNVLFAHGYSGHGISTATLAGQLLAEVVAGTAERFDVLAGVRHRRFPGGTLLRWPAMALGMLWYALRDRL
jgi:gamma-glutamylputrescine oxidase